MLRVLPEVLTIMREYRRCVEQALAVLNLPMVRHGPEIRQGDEEDELVIVGIRPVKKLLMLILGYTASACLSIPELPPTSSQNSSNTTVAATWGRTQHGGHCFIAMTSCEHSPHTENGHGQQRLTKQKNSMALWMA